MIAGRLAISRLGAGTFVALEFDRRSTSVLRIELPWQRFTLSLTPTDGFVRRINTRRPNGFGMWLRRAREARGLTLDDVIRETKIPLRNLEALEHGQLGALPEFYQRAEVRAVARALGVDERMAIGRLDSAITPVAAPSRRACRGGR